MTLTAESVLRNTWRALAFVLAYVAGAAFARHFVLAPGDIPLYWPASGLALAVVIVGGLRWAPLVPLAMLVFHAWLSPVPASFLPYAVVAPFAGLLLGGWLARPSHSAPPGTVRNGFQVLLAGTLMSLVSGLIGGYGLWRAQMGSI